jgi:hypothetical protein
MTATRGVPVRHISVSGLEASDDLHGSLVEGNADADTETDTMQEAVTGKRWTLVTLDDSMVVRKWIVNMSDMNQRWVIDFLYVCMYVFIFLNMYVCMYVCFFAVNNHY